MFTPTPTPQNSSSDGLVVSAIAAALGLFAIFSTPAALWYDKWRNRKKPQVELQAQEIANDAAQANITKVTLEAANQAITGYGTVLARLSDLEKQSIENTCEIRALKDDKYRLELESKRKDDVIKNLETRVQVLEDILRTHDIPIPNGGAK